MTEAEQLNAINTEVEFVKYKIKTFSENHVYKELIPEVDKKLADIRQAQDSLVMKVFAFKVTFSKNTSISDLEAKVYELSDQLDMNERKIRQKVAAILADVCIPDKSTEPKFAPIASTRPGHIKSKEKEFNDQIDLLSTSCGLDLGNPETEIEHDDLLSRYKSKSDADISKLVRETKSWSQALVSLSKVFREYEELAIASGEDSEDLENNQTIFDTAKSRLLDLKQIVEEEDSRRNLFTLDNTKFEKVKFPTFSGEKKEDFIKFKEKMTKAFSKNRVVLGDQLDKLKENLRGEALKHIPDTVTDLDVAWQNLNSAYGDPMRVLKERIKCLDNFKSLPPLKKKELRVTWFLELENVIEDVIQLGGKNAGTRSYCTAFSEFTIEKILSSLPEDGEDVSLRAQLSRVAGDGRELFENMKTKVAEFREHSQAFISGSSSSKKSSASSGSINTSAINNSQAAKLDSCRICSVVKADPNFHSDVDLFEGHVGNYPTHCPVFISFSTSKRKAVALKAQFCIQCLDPSVTFSRDHMSQCSVSKKDQFFTCKSNGCKSHLWLCMRHKDTSKNKAALDKVANSLKSKHNLELCLHVDVASHQQSRSHDCHESSRTFDNANELLRNIAKKSGKELVPAPSGNSLFLFFSAKGKTRPLCSFVDNGSSDVLMKEGVPGNELPGFRIREGPIQLKGVGGLTATATGEWLTCMERTDGRLQAMQVITLESVSRNFLRLALSMLLI